MVGCVRYYILYKDFLKNIYWASVFRCIRTLSDKWEMGIYKHYVKYF